MTSRDPNFDSYVMQIWNVLNRLDYYRLLGVSKEHNARQVKSAYLKIAAKFHPDRNRDADEQVKKAIYDIFKRLNEAYRVLCDQERRTYYDKLLAEGTVRLEVNVRSTMLTSNPEDSISNIEARNFYLQSKEALEKGDLLHADLHSKVAAAREPGNKAIMELAEQIKAAKQAKKQAK